MTTIGFIGKTQVTERESTLLTALGTALARYGAEFHSSNAKGATAAVNAGYRAAGKEPVIHTKGLFGATQDLVIYLDEKLYKALEPHLMRPEALDIDILYLHGPDQLERWVKALENVADQDGAEGKGELGE